MTARKAPGKKRKTKARRPIKSGLPTPDSAKLKPQEFLAFQLWMATPAKHRKPKTQQQLAKDLDVHEWTLTAWKKEDTFWEGVKSLATSVFAARMADVVNALADHAVSGKADWMASARLFLECAGVLSVEGRQSSGFTLGMLVQAKGNELQAAQAAILGQSGLVPMSGDIRSGDLNGEG